MIFTLTNEEHRLTAHSSFLAKSLILKIEQKRGYVVRTTVHYLSREAYSYAVVYLLDTVHA